ncbi:hypothetical protein FO488_15985 [Geobacter sp. FeAm09]|uniref:hypothetical protein n=1 Tax=Geobacter sp. FeAm09 TaxID=2597769 RepID=UPI0011ED6396|nr:hypothetical protein [Geobacter sp. FeAm09]QEM69508.1 hypothetical protein FO488_15985 [Geobacter sp. FeAm09]
MQKTAIIIKTVLAALAISTVVLAGWWKVSKPKPLAMADGKTAVANITVIAGGPEKSGKE